MDEKLVFYSILDFYPRRNEIKKIYKRLSYSQIIYYKKLVYTICFEREYVKDLIWEYLNDWEESYDKLRYEYYIKRKKVKNDYIEDILNIDNSSNDNNKYI